MVRMLSSHFLTKLSWWKLLSLEDSTVGMIMPRLTISFDDPLNMHTINVVSLTSAPSPSSGGSARSGGDPRPHGEMAL